MEVETVSMTMRLIPARPSGPAPAEENGSDDAEKPLTALLHGLQRADPEPTAHDVLKHTRDRVYRATVAVAVAVLLPLVAGVIATSSGAAAGAPLPVDEPAASSPASGAASPASGQQAPDVILPPGQTLSAGRWRVTLDPVEWDQTARILDANIAPPAVPDGYGWALVRMTVENVGAERAVPGTIEVGLRAGGWEVSHRDQTAGTVRIPDSFAARDLAPGESVSGNLGFWLPVRAASADSDCVLELEVRATPMADPTVQTIACNR